MTEPTVPHGRQTQREPAIPALDILWLTAGLGCDGDTIAMTAATQPSLEDLLGGAIPGLPHVRLHNPVLAVGGICIGCTMPGFPDKFMPFMDIPPGAQLSTAAVVTYGRTVRALRQFTRNAMNKEPGWRTARGPLPPT